MTDSIPQRLCPQCKMHRLRYPYDVCCTRCAKKFQPATHRIIYHTPPDVFMTSEPIPVSQIPERKSRTYLAKYGLTSQDYDTMLEAQNNACAICGKIPRMGDQLVVDHCHKSGVTRELLCRSCNTLLGFANDQIELLQKAIEYLKKHTT